MQKKFGIMKIGLDAMPLFLLAGNFYLKNPLRHPVVFTYYLQHYFKSYFVLILGDNDAKRLLLEQNGTAHMMQVLSMATHENLIEIALKVFQVRKF